MPWSREHPALTSCEILRRVETETGQIGGGADLGSGRRPLDTVRRIFDQHKTMTIGHTTESGDVDRATGVVHGNERTGPGRDRLGGPFD
jgi:hypothetical protein